MDIKDERAARNFMRWARGGSDDPAPVLIDAANGLVDVFAGAGFRCTQQAIGDARARDNTLCLARRAGGWCSEVVLIEFDRYRDARFQLSFGTKATFPQRWLRSGALVPLRDTGHAAGTWWGARWWHLDKAAALGRAVADIAPLLPQVLDFLADGSAGANVVPEARTSRMSAPRILPTQSPLFDLHPVAPMDN